MLKVRSFGVMAFVFYYASVSPADAVGRSPLVPPGGDWLIVTPVILADVPLTIRGTITIDRGGSLDLRGVNLRFLGETGRTGIEVREGGAFFARPSPVSGRRTVIRKARTGGPYFFEIRPGADFWLHGMILRGAGWDPAHPGLRIDSANSTGGAEIRILDCDFRRNFVGITLRGSSTAVVASRFRENRLAGIVLEGSSVALDLIEVRNQPVGVVADAASDMSIGGAWFTENTVGLESVGARVNVGFSVFDSNAIHARFVGPSAARVHDSVFVFATDTAVSAARGARPRLEHDDFARNAFGVRNEDGPAADPVLPASDNYWGAPDGPSGAGPGSGDPVSAGVAFAPWCQESCTRSSGDVAD